VSLAIDIGSTKICAILSELRDEHEPSIIGFGTSKSIGLKKGVITNIDEASKSIKSALDKAKQQAGTTINKAVVSISGVMLKSLDSKGIVNIPNGEVSVKDINRAIHTAEYNASIPNDYEVVHALPYSFKLDDQEEIDNPLSMNGTRLEANVYIIAAQKAYLNNLRKSIYGAGIEIENFVLNSYASSISVLEDDEKSHGVCLIDMGGSTSNMIIHSGNSIKYADYLGVGSNNITMDISKVLQAPLQVCERLKKELGTFMPEGNGVENIEIPKIGDDNHMQSVSLDIINEIILARVEEALFHLKQKLTKSGLADEIGSGVVLTGGFSQIDGIREVALKIFEDMPVRVARPKDLDGQYDTLREASYSTVLGLTLYASGKHTTYELDSNKNLRYQKEKPNSTTTSIEPLDNSIENLNIADEVSSILNSDKSESSFDLRMKESKEKTSKFINVIKNLF